MSDTSKATLTGWFHIMDLYREIQSVLFNVVMEHVILVIKVATSCTIEALLYTDVVKE